MNMQKNVPLASFTSFKVGGIAKTLIALDETDQLSEIIANVPTDEQLWMLGFGTNCLISDQGLEGNVILDRAGGVHRLSPTKFKVDSGVNWDDFIQLLINNNLWGLEFSSGIPGGVGAAIVGNIAAYGHKVADSFIEATIFNIKDGATTVWGKKDLGFSYRRSILQEPVNSHQVVLDATFQLSTEPTGELEYSSALKVGEEIGVKPDSLANRRQIIMETRRRTGSLLSDSTSGPYTAGSFFKNPLVSKEQAQIIIDHEETKISREQLYSQNQIHGENKMRVSAAHVLLAAGFKRGQTWGNVRLHPDHILKIENLGQASAQEIYDVVQTILKIVKEKLDIELEPEVRFLGDFSN